MAFQIIEKIKAGGAPTKKGCAVSVNSMTKRLFLNLRLGVDVMERLGVGHGDKMIVERGDGQHTSQLRLKPGGLSGFKILAYGKNARAGSIRLASLTTKQKHRMTAAPHKIIDGALYIELPTWARVTPAKTA